MAVICFCLRPLVLSGREERAHKQSAAIRQLGSYIWVPSSENPQGLGPLYVSKPYIGKGKVGGTAGSPWKSRGGEPRVRVADDQESPKYRSTKNQEKSPASPRQAPSPPGPRVHANSQTRC